MPFKRILETFSHVSPYEHSQYVPAVVMWGGGGGRQGGDTLPWVDFHTHSTDYVHRVEV